MPDVKKVNGKTAKSKRTRKRMYLTRRVMVTGSRAKQLKSTVDPQGYCTVERSTKEREKKRKTKMGTGTKVWVEGGEGRRRE